MNRFVWIPTCMLLMMTQASISGEIYKYTDKSGNPRFTDDISKIPAKDRSEIKTIQSVDTEPSPITEDHTSASTASKQPDVTSTLPEGSRIPVDETTGETGQVGQTKSTSLAPNKSKSQEMPKASEYPIMRDQFDQEKKQLNQQITQLQAEKKQLSDADLKTMTDKELNEQEEKENDLNARIDQLKSDQNQFLERVRQLNERIKNKQTE